MEFETEATVDEGELDALGIKKKDDGALDDGLVDAVTDDTTVDPGLLEGEEKEEVDGGIFGDDKELEDYMLSGYEEK